MDRVRPLFVPPSERENSDYVGQQAGDTPITEEYPEVGAGVLNHEEMVDVVLYAFIHSRVALLKHMFGLPEIARLFDGEELFNAQALLTIASDLLSALKFDVLDLLAPQFSRLVDKTGVGSLLHVACQLCDEDPEAMPEDDADALANLNAIPVTSMRRDPYSMRSTLSSHRMYSKRSVPKMEREHALTSWKYQQEEQRQRLKTVRPSIGLRSLARLQTTSETFTSEEDSTTESVFESSLPGATDQTAGSPSPRDSDGTLTNRSEPQESEAPNQAHQEGSAEDIDGGDAVSQQLKLCTDALQYLLQFDISLDVPDQRQCIALHYAARAGWPVFKYASFVL